MTMETQSASSAGSAELRPRTGLSVVAGVIGVVLCSLPFYLSVVPPMTDVPAHVLVARIIAEYDDPVLRFSDYFTIEWALAPCVLCYWLLVQLQQLVGPYWDARVYLTIWVLTTWFAVWYLAKVQGQRDPWLAALVALPLAFCWYAYKGFLPFLMTLPLFALSIAVWFADLRPVVKVPLLWALLAMLFGFHIVGTAAAVAVILIGACTQVFILREDRRQLVWAGMSVIPVLLITGGYLLAQESPSATIGYRDLLSQVVDVVKFTAATLDETAAALMLVWLVLLGLVFVVRWRDLTKASPILISAAVLLGLSIAMPGSLGALWPAGPRLLPFAIVLLVAGVRWGELHRMAVVASCVLLLAGLSLFTARRVIDLDRGFRDLLGAADMVRPGTRVLPIVVDQHFGSRWTTPYLHVATIYTMTRGGSNPYVLADPHVLTGASPLKFRHASDARQFAFLYDKNRGAPDYKGVGDYYDYVLLWGASPAIADVLDQEMSRVYARGAATLFARRRDHGGSENAFSMPPTVPAPR